MFARAASVFVLALPLLATASVLPRNGGGSSCDTGSLQCCSSVQSVNLFIDRNSEHANNFVLPLT